MQWVSGVSSPEGVAMSLPRASCLEFTGLCVDMPKGIYLEMSPPFLSLCPLSQGPRTNSLERRWVLRRHGLIALVGITERRDLCVHSVTHSQKETLEKAHRTRYLPVL